jgi:hypothetical protein
LINLSERYCNIERPFHGTCLNLQLGMGCSSFSSSLCVKYAEKVVHLQSQKTKKKIDLAKKLGLYDNNSACIIFDIPCESCNVGLIDASEVKKVKGKYICESCK